MSVPSAHPEVAAPGGSARLGRRLGGRWRCWPAAATIVLAVAACSSSSEFEVVATDTDPRLLVMENGAIGTDAQVVGQLRYLDQQQCFILEYAESVANGAGAPLRYPAVWPDGTRPINRGDAIGVDVPDVGEIVEGTWLLGGGGYYRDGNPVDLPDLPPECLSSYREYAFVERITETSTEEIRP